MGKIINYIGGFFGLTLTIGIGGLATGAYFLIDNSEIEMTDFENASALGIDYLLNKVQVELDNSYSSKDVNLNFDVLDLEYIFYPFLNSIDISPFNIEAFAINYENDFYNIIIKGSYDNKISTTLKAILDINQNDEGIEIKLEDIYLGKVKYTSISRLLETFNINIATVSNQESIDSNLSLGSLNLETLTYTLTYNEVLDYIKSLGNYDYLSDTLTELLTNKDLLEINLGSDNVFGTTIHLKRLMSENIFSSYDIKVLEKKIETLLNNNIISKDKASLVFEYLIKGYNYLSNEEKEYINKLDLQDIEINNNALYYGIIKRNNLTINDAFNNIITIDKFANILINKKIDFELSKSELSTILMNLDFIGESILLTNTLNNDISYLAIKQINIDSVDNDLTLDLICDINGNDVYLEAKANVNEASGLLIDGKIYNVSLGDLSLSENQIKAILDFLEKNVKTSWLNIDANNSNVIFNFESLMAENETLNKQLEILENLGYEPSIKTSLTSNGVLISYLFNT